jgi:carboxymethylenebutenolidase
MCDQDHYEEDLLEYEARGMVTRRQFGVLLGAGMMMALPKVVDAVTVTGSDVTIKTPDGTCDAYFAHPVTGAAPAVLVWPDIFGLRPAMQEMAKRLAESGYSSSTRSIGRRRPRPPRRARPRRSRSSSR